MKRKIRKIGVLGAGTMGSGIAAQAANAGIEVVLLDKFAGKADKEVQRMLAAKPTDAFNAGFMAPQNAKLIKTGTTDENLDELADCDWIIETILVPDHKIREQLYRDVQKVAKKDAIFSSNTSTMPVSYMVGNQDEDFKSRFLNTHFFNPVRFMHLLEVIPGDDTDPDVIEAISDFGDKVLGKKIVLCKNARGFIANRIGIYAMERAKVEAIKQNTRIEDVDAIMGKAFGFPHLGLFKLADEVGLDVVDHVRGDLHDNLPADDNFQQIFTGNEELQQMLKDGYFGNRKADSKGGYYRRKTDEKGKPVLGDNGKPLKEARDLRTGTYRDFENSPYFKFENQVRKMGGLQAFLDSDHPAAAYAWPVVRDLLLYVLDHAEELAYDVQSIDDAMRAGYNWEKGPFQILDDLGVNWFKQKLVAEGIEVPALLEKAMAAFYLINDDQLKVMDFNGEYKPVRREEGVISLEDIKRRSKPLVTHNSASLWDIGDGIVCLEFHSQQNSIDPSILHVINESIKLVSESNGKYKGMVIYNDAPRFSVGANLKLAEVFMDAADNKWQGLLGKKQGAQMEKWAPRLGIPWLAYIGLKKILHEMIFQGQAVYTALNQAPFPVIGAPKGQPQNMAFGGGNEVLMNCDAIQSGPEQVMGLPEIGVGILPAWTGTTRYLQRAFEAAKRGVKGPMAPVIRTAMALADPLSSTATSAQDAKRKLWLGRNDGITMNPDRVLADAKAKALAMAPGYKPKPLPAFTLPGPSGRGAIRMDVDKMYMQANPPAKGVNHIDVKTADRLATVLTGGETLKREDVRHHAAAHHAHLEKLASEKPKGRLTVNPAITLTYNRMMQLERDYILDAFRDRKDTWPRLRHTLATNAPLREPRPDPAPSPKELRESMAHEDLPRRDIDGQPLNGKNAERLAAMADMTREFYRLVEARDPKQKQEQMKRTAKAIGCVFLKL